MVRTWSFRRWPAAQRRSPSPAQTRRTPPQPGSARELQLKIDADKETYLTVFSDGQQIFAGAIFAGESRSFSAKNALTVETQDAGAIRLELNGQTLAPIGPLGQPGKITLGRQDLKSESGGHD